MERFENFSFLPPLSLKEVQKQVEDILLSENLPIMEYLENPTSQDIYWNTWRLPHEKYLTSQWIMNQIEACAKRHPFSYVRICGYDKSKKMTTRSFVVKTPVEIS